MSYNISRKSQVGDQFLQADVATPAIFALTMVWNIDYFDWIDQEGDSVNEFAQSAMFRLLEVISLSLSK